ncbi:MAG TPA: SDR family oxidoreductase [Streptosporangiaceae bacterium]|nr:SDR family oxidoreductase [Streptosporangiaceae bacterium]
MRVFVTGASGHIGSALIPELQAAGHEVTGLARSDASAEKLEAAGVQVRRGDLGDLDVIAKAAADADGVIHLAYKRDLMRSGDIAGLIAANQAVLEAVGDALEGTGKPFVSPVGTLVLWAGGITGRPGTEDDTVASGPLAAAENATAALAGRGVRAAVIRLSPVVHSYLDAEGFTPALIAIARDKDVAAYVGDGANRWPAVHTLDAARLFRLALESAPAGARLHGVAEEGVPFREFASAIGRNLGVPTASIAPDEAAGHFGFLAMFAGADNPTSSALTRQQMGWEATHPGLIADLDAGHYFA